MLLGFFVILPICCSCTHLYLISFYLSCFVLMYSAWVLRIEWVVARHGGDQETSQESTVLGFTVPSSPTSDQVK